MRKNVGSVDSMIRLTLGYFLWGKSVQRRSTLLLLFSSMQIASGITRFCPMYKLCDLSTNHGFKMHRILK